MASPYQQSAWIDVYHYPYGRMVYAAREVRRRAEALNLSRIVGACDRALASAAQWRELTRQWDIARSRQTTRRFSAEAMALDPQLDDMLGGLDGLLENLVRLSARKPERAATATRVRQTVFPAGVRDVVGLSYEQQHEEVVGLLALLDGELAADVEALGLRETCDDLRELSAQFGAAIAFEGARETITWDQVEAAQARAQSTWLGLIAVILGQYPWDDDAEDIERRAHLLAPIEDQRQALARGFQRRRGVRDIDPETGRDVAPGVTAEPQPAEPEPV